MENKKFRDTQKVIKRKVFSSRTIFITLNVLAIIISSLVVVLNLYAIRWNERPVETMDYFVDIAIMSASTTFFLSLQAFLGITNRKNKLKQNIDKIDEIIEMVKEKDNLDQDDLDSISEILD
ncbi:hypothetical protein [Mycoplasma procyoni]|uniref:hypothetical protein n=1 Tax=Mycoplasma procyoni TaxID=568784 RepID=UPI00197BCC57|nr:hypothetical protein [Mycoplasma procyoni]MBN3534679.1 hypothetical protein [Mycoplasma procyoni]